MKPLSVETALDDKQLLGAAFTDLASWATWRTVLKAAFGDHLTPGELVTFREVAGNRSPPNRRVRELWAICGRRSGKSRVAAVLAVYFAAFVRHKLARGEVGVVLVLAASQAQAQAVFTYAVGILESSPILAAEVRSATTSEIRLRNGLVIAIHSNSYRTVRGRTLVNCVFDEIAWWRDETSAVPDTEVYRAVLPSLASTGGMLVGISSPYRKAGLLFTRWRDHFARDDKDVLVVSGPSRLFNPTLDAEIIESARASDPEAARSEWDAEWRADISAFLDDELIDAAVDHDRPLELPPRSGLKYVAFCDPSGGRGDQFAICIGHSEDGRFVADVVRGRAPPFDPADVVSEFASLAQEYRCREINGDNYSAGWVENAFKEARLTYVRSGKAKSQLYVEALPLFTRAIITIPDHSRLLRELRLLERRTHRSGRDTVDHGRSGSDDHANALCGCAVVALRPRRRSMLDPEVLGLDEELDPRAARLFQHLPMLARMT